MCIRDSNNQVLDTVSGNHLTVDYASGTGFVEGTVVDDLHVAQTAANGTSVGFVVPHETQDTTQEVYTFSLADDANGRFAIDPSTGEITVADGMQLDFSADVSHDVIVEVEDSEGRTAFETFTVTVDDVNEACLLYTSPSPRDATLSRMPSSA